MFERQTCTTCKTPHPSGELKCSGCDFTVSEMGVTATRRTVAGRDVYEYSEPWAYCPLCGEPTGIKSRARRTHVMTLPT